jgi:hypothetical protein
MEGLAMLGRIRPQLTYANVISSLCMFLLLGTGVTWAATTLAKDSVGSKQIQKGAVGGSELKNRSLTAQEFAPGVQLRGPQGPRGLRGESGKDGSDGATKVVTRRGNLHYVNADQTASASASCGAGERVTGGGFTIGIGNVRDVVVSRSGPTPTPDGGPIDNPTGWSVTALNQDVDKNDIEPYDLYAYALCASP